MSTSGTYTFTVNRDQLIRLAMLNIGKLDDTETPTAQEVSDCSTVLNMLVKQWQGKADFAPGLKVWTRRRGYLFLNSTTGQYTVGPGGTGWTNSFVHPTVTTSTAAGATVIGVSSATGVVAGYNIGIEQGDGSLFWTTVSTVVGTTVTLAAALTQAVAPGAQVYCYQTTGTQPVVVETALLRDNTGNDTPLNLMTVQDYDYLPNKAAAVNPADPTAIYYEFQLTNSNLFTDCAQANDVTKYIVLTYLEAVQDLNSPSDNFEYPQEWYLALAWGLSKQICPMFNVPWTQIMDGNYKESLAIAQHKDKEISTMYFQLTD